MQGRQRRPAPRRAGRRRRAWPDTASARSRSAAAFVQSCARRQRRHRRRPRRRRLRRDATTGPGREPAAGDAPPACGGVRREQRQRVAVPLDGRPGGDADDGVAGFEEDRRGTGIARLGTAAHVGGELDHVDRQAGVADGRRGGRRSVACTRRRSAGPRSSYKAERTMAMGEAVPATGRLEDAGPRQQVERVLHRLAGRDG